VNSEHFIYFIIGVFVCNALISFSFFLGHKGLDIYQVHGKKLLTSLGFFILIGSDFHKNPFACALAFLFLGIMPLTENKIYHNYISSGREINNTIRYLGFSLSGLAITVLLLHENVNFRFLSHSVGFILITYLLLELKINRDSIKQTSKKGLIIAAILSEIFLYLTLISANYSSWIKPIAIIICILSFLHIFFITLLLVPRVLVHLEQQEIKRINRLQLKRNNLKQLKNNNQLENEVASAVFYSELVSLDLNFLSQISTVIINDLDKNKDRSSIILTKLAKHLRNHVYFQNRPSGSLFNEVKALKDFMNLCNILDEKTHISLELKNGNEFTEDISIRTHILLPCVKSVFKASFSREFRVTNRVLIDYTSDDVILKIDVDSEKKVLNKNELGLEYIQSRLLDQKEDFGEILDVSENRLHLKLSRIKHSN
jgi:hypothetical protein